jgi:hypothetical protein
MVMLEQPWAAVHVVQVAMHWLRQVSCVTLHWFLHPLLLQFEMQLVSVCRHWLAQLVTVWRHAASGTHDVSGCDTSTVPLSDALSVPGVDPSSGGAESFVPVDVSFAACPSLLLPVSAAAPPSFAVPPFGSN